LNNPIKNISEESPLLPYSYFFDMYIANKGTPITFKSSNRQILKAILN